MASLGELVSAAWPSMLVGGGVFGLPGIWWAHKRATRKQTDDVSIAIVKELKALVAGQTERINSLEAQVVSERHACAAQIGELREAMRAESAEAQLRESKLLHRLKNREQDLSGLVWVIEFAPERAADAVARLNRLREERERENA
jgi:hypothetical protein